MIRQRLRTNRQRGVTALTLVSFLAMGLYTTVVEPYSIEATHHRVYAPLDSPLKIAHLSDLHTRGLGLREERLLALLDAEQPDMIVVTGDSRAGYWGTNEMIREIFSRLKAPVGVYVVRGNHDHAWWFPKQAGFGEIQGLHYLSNAALPAREGVWVVGLDDASTGSPDLPTALKDVPAGVFKIGLFHSPVSFEEAAGKVDVAFAGHTHGGQVRPPFIRPFWLPSGTGDYLEGWYEKNGSRLYVSRGIGTSILPIRFLCRPEVAFIVVGK